jgi:hypothetical protein
MYLVGGVIAVALFFYLISSYESVKERVKGGGRAGGGDAGPPIKIEPRNIFMKNMKRPPGARLCPLCGSTLTQFEALYAEQLKGDKGRKILILGCRYCYKEGEGKGGR